MGRALLLHQRPDPRLNTGSPPVPGGPTKVRRAQRGGAWRQRRHCGFAQKVLHQRRPEFQTALRRGLQSQQGLRFTDESRSHEVLETPHVPDQSRGENRKRIHERESAESQRRSAVGVGCAEGNEGSRAISRADGTSAPGFNDLLR
jgi:hypothetical protein